MTSQLNARQRFTSQWRGSHGGPPGRSGRRARTARFSWWSWSSWFLLPLWAM